MNEKKWVVNGQCIGLAERHMTVRTDEREKRQQQAKIEMNEMTSKHKKNMNEKIQTKNLKNARNVMKKCRCLVRLSAYLNWEFLREFDSNYPRPGAKLFLAKSWFCRLIQLILEMASDSTRNCLARWISREWKKQTITIRWTRQQRFGLCTFCELVKLFYAFY